MIENRGYLEQVIIEAIKFYNGFLEYEVDLNEELTDFDREAIILLVLGYYNRKFELNLEVNCYTEKVKKLYTVNSLVEYLDKNLIKKEN